MDGSRIEIESRFNGPTESGQGGYSCGVFAGLLPGQGPAEVTLRKPIPLGRPLGVDRLEGGAIAVIDDDALVAEARSAPLEIEVPPPVSLGEAARASERFRSEAEVFARCFVCGPQREDSQRVFPGPVEGRRVVATPWTPEDEWLADGDFVRPEFVWAVLDCPTHFALEIGRPGILTMMGRMTARLLEPVPIGEPHVVMAWPIGSEGRKHEAGSAVFSGSGELRAAAKAIHIEVGGAPDPGSVA